MLNIFRLSKMLLISGMVLAFSCVTFNADMAYALTCNEARNNYKQEEEKYNATVENLKIQADSLKTKMDKAERQCKRENTALVYCTEYQQAKNQYSDVTLKMSGAKVDDISIKDDLITAQNALKEACKGEGLTDADSSKATIDNVYNLISDEAIEDQKNRMEAACARGNTSECKMETSFYNQSTEYNERARNQAAQSGKKGAKNEEKSQKSRSNREEAAEEKDTKAEAAKTALLSINDASRDVDKAEKAMKTACDEDPEGDNCKTAKNDYVEASKELEAAKENYNKNLKDAQQDYNKAVRKDARAQKKDDKRADKAVEKAQKDVDKYCTLGHASYNAEKCTKAQNDLALAETDETYVQNHGEKDTRTQDEKISDIDRAAAENAKSITDPKSAGQNYVSEGELTLLEKAKEQKDEKAKEAQENADGLKQARDAVCAGNEKSKKCREADEKYQAAQDNADNLRQQANSAYGAYKNAEAKKEAADKIIADCMEKTTPECKKAKEQKAQEDIDGLTAKGMHAKELERNFDNARKEQAKICNQDPGGIACKEAEARTKAAKNEKDTWEEKNPLNSHNSLSEGGNLDYALNINASASDVDALNDDIRAKEKEIENLENQRGSLETGVAVACKREKSRACKEAKAELEAFDNKLNTLKEEKDALDVKREVMNDQHNSAKTILAEKCGDNIENYDKSPECMAARKTMNEKELEDAKAFKEKTESAQKSAQANYDRAKKAAEEACGQNISEGQKPDDAPNGTVVVNDITPAPEPGSACSDAMAKLKNAADDLSHANVQNNTADLNLLSAEVEQGNIADIEKDMATRACNEDPTSEECKRLMQNLNSQGNGPKLVYKETGAVFTQATPPSGHVFSYITEDGDVFEIVTRRIAFIILYIKPIVYIFAGFGLIAVAFGAIFNKMSWRHFSYVAIGLFMVANVGRLIEFVVTPYVEQNGQWVSDVGGQKQTEIQRDLSSAFGDTYHTFGYVMEDPVQYREIDLGEFIEIGKEVKGADSGILDGLAKKRGFCEGSSGSGWSNFKSCINDIVGTVKNVGNMVKGAVNTVYGVAGQARKAKDAIVNISNSFKNMKGASASEIFNEFSNIMHYTDDFNDAVTGAIDTVGNGAINILNEAGDIGSAESYGGQSMSDILADGFFNISGTARSVEGLASDIQREKDAKKQGIGIYNKDGVFGKDGFGGFGKPSSNKNTSGTSASGTISSTISSSGTGSATSGTSGSGTTNVTHTSETTYEDAVKKTNNMYSDIQKQERELNNLKNQMAQAQKAADEACKEGSALCDVYKAQAASYDAMIKAGESKLSDTKSAYDTAKSENDQLYEQMLANNRANAEDELEIQKAEATKVCKGDPTSAECVKALKKVNDATTKLAKAIEEQEKRTKASYKETTEQKQGADNSTKYDISVDNVNDLYNKEQAKEKELTIVSSEIDKLQKQMDENNCSSNPNSDICKALGDQKSSLEGYKTEQENALKDIQKDKKKAQDAMDKEYKQYLKDNVKSAEEAQKSAQAEVDKACAGNNSNSESCLKARNKLIESINNVAKAKEEQKNPTDRTQTNEEKDQAKADQERKRQEANKKNSDEYNASVDNVNDLYKKEQAKQKEIDAVEGEISNLQDQYKENGCPNPKKAVCGALENQLDSLDKYKKEKESEKAQITKDKTNAEKNMEQEYKDYLQKNVDSAEAAQTKAQAEVDKSCTAGNEGSAACVKARKDLIDSMNNVAKAKEEQKKPTDRTQTNEEKDQAKADQERKRQEANKKNSDEYNASVDNVNDLYKKEQAKQKEIDAVEGEISNLQDQYKENGCPNPKKAVCGALENQLDSLDKYKKEKESEKAQITKDKTNAEKNMEQEYKDYLQKNVDSAEAAQTKAQAEVDKSCTAGNEGSAACVKARKDLIDSMNNVAKAKEEQKKPTDRTQTNEEKDAKRRQTQEDKERQQALDEYDSKTNPEKVAQDLKNTYSELQEEVNRAKSTYNEKKQRTKDTKEAYEKAKAKADQSGKPADIAEAKRLEKEYKNAQKEEKAAEKNLSDLDAKTKSTKTYYLQRAIDSETYKQAKYKAEMATISSDVSALEADITAKRKEAEKLADRIMKLSSKSSLTDDEKIAIVTLRKEYEIAKAEYNQMKNEITQAKNRFEQLKNMYNKSVSDKKALEDELKSLK